MKKPHMPATATAAARFRADERGAVSVELVIVLPAVIAILMLFVSAALHFAVAADVQQMAHELARAALPYAGSPGWCTILVQHWADAVAASFPMLSPERVAGVECRLEPATGLAMVQVTYDAAQTPGSVFGRPVGLDLASITRRGLVQI